MKHEVNMRECIQLLGLANRYTIKSSSSNNICPVCGDERNPRKKKLNINFKKGVFRCNKCGFAGNTLDFWAFHRGLTGSYKDIFKDYANCYNSGSASISKSEKRYEPVPEEKEIPVDPCNIDKVYRAFLNLLYLSDEHRDNLKRRGLSETAIVEGLYRSLPQTAVKSIPKKLITRGYNLEGVPGFFIEKGEWKFKRYGNGFLIPSMDIDGKIMSLQLRKDTVDKGETRYFTISTDGYEKGTKGTAAPHYNPGKIGPRTVIITEGPLKGNIISHLTGYPVVAVMGVNTLGKIPVVLKRLFQNGTREIKIAYDMDYIDNPHVEEACRKLERLILRSGFRYTRVVWDPGKADNGELPYKGLDDYLTR